MLYVRNFFSQGFDPELQGDEQSKIPKPIRINSSADPELPEEMAFNNERIEEENKCPSI